jgi:hypothetical protein
MIFIFYLILKVKMGLSKNVSVFYGVVFEVNHSDVDKMDKLNTLTKSLFPKHLTAKGKLSESWSEEISSGIRIQKGCYARMIDSGIWDGNGCFVIYTNAVDIYNNQKLKVKSLNVPNKERRQRLRTLLKEHGITMRPKILTIAYFM